MAAPGRQGAHGNRAADDGDNKALEIKHEGIALWILSLDQVWWLHYRQRLVTADSGATHAVERR